MIWITEKDGSNLRRLNVSSCVHVETINGEQTLNLKTSDPIKKYDLVIFKNSLNEWNEFVVRGTDQDRNGTTVYLEHSSYELHDFIIREKRPENKSAEFILGEILNGTRWAVGTSDISGTYTLNMYYMTAYESIKKLVELTGCELEFKFTIDENNQIVSRIINLKSSLGEDRGRIFTYSKDMYGVRRTINDDVITALIGRGKGEQISEDGWGRRINLTDLNMPDSPLGADYVEDVVARDIFGIYNNGVYLHRYGTIEFDDIEDVDTLYLETKKVLALNSVPRITYEVEVAILNTIESRVALGDVIHIFDSDFNGEVLKLHGRVQKIKHDLLFPENGEVIIGNILSNMSYFQTKVDSQLNSMRSKISVWDRANAFNSNNQLPASYIQDLLAEWNNLANLSGGYTYSFEGMGTITYDRPYDADPPPTQAVQIVGGTIRIANSKTIDGEWIWKTVINANGIAGEQILANSITANKLSSDVGESLDISSNQAITLRATKTEVTEAVNNVQVGGRNLYTQTSNEWASVTFGGWQAYFHSIPIGSNQNLNVGEQITWSGVINPESQIGGIMAHFELAGGGFTQHMSNFISGGTIGKVTGTTIVPENAVSLRLALRHTSGTTPSQVFNYKELKIEKGNKATDWTPAPEDVDRRITNAESEIQLTKDFFSLTFTKNLHEMKNKLVYDNGVHMYGSEMPNYTGFEIIETRAPFLWTRTKFQGISIYNFMPSTTVAMYNIKTGVPYTFSCLASVGVVPTGLLESSLIFKVFYYTSVNGSPILLQQGSWAGLSELMSGSLTFTLPSNTVGWLLRMECSYRHSNTNEYAYVDLQNVQLEEGSSVTSFSNNASTISGARYVFNGDNASFYNGGLRIFNKLNTQVFGADTNGDLWVSSLKIAGGDAWHTGNLNPYPLRQYEYNSLYNYLGGGYVSGGLEKPNNSLFGAGKLKLQMLSGVNINAPAGWYDTLWLSSYTGGDVKGSNLLSFAKQADRIGFSRQDYDSGVWGTWREIWHTGNFNPSDYMPRSTTFSVADLNAVTLNGFYRQETPSGAYSYTTTLNMNSSDGRQQLMLARDGSGMMFRGVNSGSGTSGWTSWKEVWHTGNFNPSNYALTSHSHATLTNGLGIVGSSYNGSTARTWNIGAGTGISVDSLSVFLTDIASGSSTNGALRYSGTGAQSGKLNGGTSIINTSGETTRLNYNGQFTATGIRWGINGGSALSDEILKYDIKDIEDNFILNLHPVSFRYHADGKELQYGLIAQEVEKIVGDNVAIVKKPNEDNYFYGLDYTQLIAPMIDVIQKQQKRIDEIERLLERLALA